MIGKEVGPVELHVVAPVHVFIDAHGMFAKYLATVGIIVEEAFGFRHGDAFEEFEMSQSAGPVTMRGLELDHGHEGLFLVSILPDPLQSEVGDEIVAVALVALATSVHLDEVRIIVGSLPRENTPEIESDGIRVEVPLSDHCDLVAGISQQLGKSLLVAVKIGRVVIEEPVEVTVFSGQDIRPGGTTD